MKSKVFDPAEPINILSFLPLCKEPCDWTSINDGAAISLLQYYVKKTTKEALTARFTTSGNRCKNRGNLSSYPEVINFLLFIYGTVEVIVEADAEITCYRQPDCFSPSQYADEHWNKALRCGTAYSEDRLNGFFIEGSHESI